MNALLDKTRYLDKDENTSPFEQLRTIIRIQLETILRHVKTNDILFDTELRHLTRGKKSEIVKLREEYIGIVQKTISNGIKTGVFAKIDVTLISFYIVSIIVRSRLWYSPSGKLSIDGLADHIFETVVNGIAPRK
jgi:hypothetical protein